jgi:hypothetical protein
MRLRFENVVASVLLIFVSAAVREASAHDISASVRACESSQLRASVLDDERSMMHREIAIALENVSMRPCSLHGFPTIGFLDAFGHIEGNVEQRDIGTKPEAFIIARKQRGMFGLRLAIGDGLVFYKTAPILVITLPSNVMSLKLRYSVPVATTILVKPLRPALSLPAATCHLLLYL